MTIHMRYDSSYLNLPHNGSLPRGGGLGWGQGYKFQKTYAFAWFGKRSIIAIHRKFQTRRVAEDSTRLYGEATQHSMRLSVDGYKPVAWHGEGRT